MNIKSPPQHLMQQLEHAVKHQAIKDKKGKEIESYQTSTIPASTVQLPTTFLGTMGSQKSRTRHRAHK